MSIIDIIIFIFYFALMLSIGIYFYKKNKNIDDYYVGGRSLSSWHIGLSVVATDVGGGFSIGLGGLGFAIGIAGSWMLFTGLIGAWVSAVLLIPTISKLDAEMGLPILLNTVLPVGLIGLVLSAYFSAILSTADSTLMAASGNVQTDILQKIFNFKSDIKSQLLKLNK